MENKDKQLSIDYMQLLIDTIRDCNRSIMRQKVAITILAILNIIIIIAFFIFSKF